MKKIIKGKKKARIIFFIVLLLIGGFTNITECLSYDLEYDIVDLDDSYPVDVCESRQIFYLSEFDKAPDLNIENEQCVKIEPLSDAEKGALAVSLGEQLGSTTELPKSCIEYFRWSMADGMGREFYSNMDKLRKNCIEDRSKYLWK